MVCTHILVENDVERMMANRAKQPVRNGANVQFPPEADTDFDLVPEEQIAAWNDKLKKRYGIGSGRLVVLDGVHASA